MKIGNFVKRFAKNEDGAGIVEYALLIVLIGAVASFGLVFLGDTLASFFGETAANFATPANFADQSTPFAGPT